MYPTKYHKPASIAEAVAALSSGEDAMLLAGGQTLIGTMKNHLAAPSDLVDIRQIDGMSGVSSEGDTLRIGATTTHAEGGDKCRCQTALSGACGAGKRDRGSGSAPHGHHRRRNRQQ